MRPNDCYAARLLAAVMIAPMLLAGCSAGGANDPAPAASASATSTASPSEKIVKPLLDSPEVDLATLPLPDAPNGINPQTWKSNARSARDLAVASQDRSLWDSASGSELVAKVARAAPPRIGSSMLSIQTKDEDEPAGALFWGPVFAADNQPDAARIVDARWTSGVSNLAGKPLTTALIQLTTVYTVGEGRHVVIERQFGLGSTRPAPDLGQYAWTVDAETGGADACRYYTDGEIAPSDAADLDKLQEIVDRVVDQSDIDTTYEQSDLADLRKKACSPEA